MTSRHFKTSEKELHKTLAQKDPTFSDIDALLNKVRSSFENLIFASLGLATSHDAETRLWDYHGKVNSRYRRQLAKFHDEEGKKKPVEKRKLEKHYLDFIKSSMRFYRGYIQRLASVYGDIPELSQIASRFKMDSTFSRALHKNTQLIRVQRHRLTLLLSLLWRSEL